MPDQFDQTPDPALQTPKFQTVVLGPLSRPHQTPDEIHQTPDGSDQTPNPLDQAPGPCEEVLPGLLAPFRADCTVFLNLTVD